MAHKVDSEGAGPGNTWVEASPGVPKTLARSKWYNMAVDELIAFLDAAGITPDDANNGQVSAAMDVLFGSSAAAALKNKLINGSCRVWQRGTSIFVGNLETFTADRWAATADATGAGAGIATVSRQAFTDGQTDVPSDPAYFLRWAQTTQATAGQPMLVQKLEDVASLAGAFATFSFYGRADANSLITVRLVQRFGSGGSADVIVGSLALPITTLWTRQKYSIAIPSLLGKTIGAGSSLRLELLLPSVQTFTFDLANLQLEPGTNATPFEIRLPGLEYALAARYYEKSYRLDDAPGTADSTRWRDFNQVNGEAGANTNLVTLNARFRFRKRATPTIVWYPVEGSIASGQVSTYNQTTPTTLAANLAVASTLDSSEAATGVPTLTGHPSGNMAAAHWTADAEL